MSLVTKSFTFTTGATIIASEHNSNFDILYADYDGNIDNTNIKASAAIVDTKLNQITTAGKVSGAALTSLASIPSGAGVIPAANLTSIITAGMIVMWNSTVATIPSGWVLCDGTNSTPDLRDKFIVGAKQDSGGAAKTNITGSLTQSGGSTTITTSNMPAHTHQTTSGQNGGGSNSGSQKWTSGVSQYGDITDSVGGGTAYTPPYYALCFIQKT